MACALTFAQVCHRFVLPKHRYKLLAVATYRSYRSSLNMRKTNRQRLTRAIHMNQRHKKRSHTRRHYYVVFPFLVT